eukprot:s1385_g24.t1
MSVSACLRALIKERFVHPLGDHLTLIRVYNMWEEDGCSPELHSVFKSECSVFAKDWCKENFLHFRALRQARDIRSQLYEQLEKVSEVLCQFARLFRSARKMTETADAIAIATEVATWEQKRRDLGNSGQSAERFRLGRSASFTSLAWQALLKSLCSGFFMQTARACGAAGGWLIVGLGGENVLVKCESSSAMDGSSAEWVLYTDLVGSTVANCMMRTVSAVDHKWLQPLLPKLQEVNMKRLVGMSKPSQQTAEA